MKQRISELLKRPGVRYLIVGGLIYALELAIIAIAQLQGMQPVPAVALAFIIGTAVSFVMQKFVTFGDKRMHHKIVGFQLAATILLVVFNFLFSVLMTKLLQHVWPAVVIRTVALGITTIWNFYLYKTRIFKGAEEFIS